MLMKPVGADRYGDSEMRGRWCETANATTTTTTMTRQADSTIQNRCARVRRVQQPCQQRAGMVHTVHLLELLTDERPCSVYQDRLLRGSEMKLIATNLIWRST